MNIDMKRKIGRFSISDELVKQNPEAVKKVMGQCVIIKAEYIDHLRIYRYEAISDLFEKGWMSYDYLMGLNSQGKVTANKMKGEQIWTVEPTSPPVSPKPPLGRHINENTCSSVICKKCNSSTKRKYIFFGEVKCIHTECGNIN